MKKIVIEAPDDLFGFTITTLRVAGAGWIGRNAFNVSCYGATTDSELTRVRIVSRLNPEDNMIETGFELVSDKED